MATTRPRSVVSFLWMLIFAVIGSVLLSGTAGYFIGKNNLAGEFSVEQVQFVDGLIAGTEFRVERDQWLEQFKAKRAADNDIRAFPGQRCAGKFFPDQPVAMKGCLAAQEPRPPKGYQYP